MSGFGDLTPSIGYLHLPLLDLRINIAIFSPSDSTSLCSPPLFIGEPLLHLTPLSEMKFLQSFGSCL